MSKNIIIPCELFFRTIELLQYWNVAPYDPIIRDEYDYIVMRLTEKLQRMELRTAYANIISATSEDERHDARIRYLQQKRLLKAVENEPL